MKMLYIAGVVRAHISDIMSNIENHPNELLSVSCKKLNFQAVIKSAAGAASPKTKIQESRGT